MMVAWYTMQMVAAFLRPMSPAWCCSLSDAFFRQFRDDDSIPGDVHWWWCYNKRRPAYVVYCCCAWCVRDIRAPRHTNFLCWLALTYQRAHCDLSSLHCLPCREERKKNCLHSRCDPLWRGAFCVRIWKAAGLFVQHLTRYGVSTTTCADLAVHYILFIFCMPVCDSGKYALYAMGEVKRRQHYSCAFFSVWKTSGRLSVTFLPILLVVCCLLKFHDVCMLLSALLCYWFLRLILWRRELMLLTTS